MISQSASPVTFSGSAQNIGVALEGNVVRVAAATRGNLHQSEFAWDSNSPEHLVDQLRTTFGSVSGIALSVGLAFLEIAKPELPPMSPDNMHRVLRRDADRYFPIESAAAVGGPYEGGVAYATSSEWLHRVVRALETWGPVRAIVPAPNAIALMAGRKFVSGGTVVGPTGKPVGLPSSTTVVSSTTKENPQQLMRRSFVIDAASDEFGLLQLQNGVVTGARRIPKMVGLQSADGAFYLDQGSMSTGSTKVHGVHANGKPIASGAFAAAIGALDLVNAPLSAMLLDASIEQSLGSRRVQRQWFSYAALAAAVLLLAASVNARRTNTLRATQHAVDSLAQLAIPGLASQKQLAQLNEELRVLTARDGASRDPLSVVATLSLALPADAFVERIAWDGSEWRIDGSANQAASVVPHLDSARTFTDVRVLSASTRFRDGARMRESFAVAFKVRGDSSGRR